MATHSSILAWRIPWMEEPGGLQSWGRKESDMTERTHFICMKSSLGISNFLEEISSLSHSIVFLYFFALIAEEGFLSLLAILWNSAFKWVYLSFSPLPFTSLLFSVICKTSSDNHFAFSFVFLWDGLDHCLLDNSSGTLIYQL